MKFKLGHISLLLLAALSLNCFKEPLSPVLPTWDATATFPIASRTYTLADLIAKDSSLLKVGAGTQISFSKSAEVPPTFVEDMLSLSPKDTSVQLQLGAFSVNPTTQRVAVAIPQLSPGTAPIPPLTMNLADVRSKIDAFNDITLKSGEITLHVQNNLPVPMQLTTPIQLLDPLGNVVADFVFNPSTIPAFGSAAASDDLTAKKVTGDFQLRGFNFYTPGSSTPVTIPAGDLIVATLSTGNLKASQATLAEIPSQQLSSKDTAKLRMDDSTLVKELYLKSGSLQFSLTNNIPLSMVFKFRFNDVHRRVGGSYVPYEDSLYLAGNGSGTMQLNLANARIRSVDGSLLRSLGVLGSIRILPSAGQPVTISETDRVSIAVTKRASFVVDSAIGVVKPTWVNVDTKIGLNLGKGLQKFSGQINLPSASLKLTTNSSIGFPADAYLKLGARKSNGDSVFVQVPPSQRRLTPGQDVIEFDGAEIGQFLSQLSSKLPDSIRISGRILVNPSDVYVQSNAGVASVGSQSFVGGSAFINIPLSLGVVNGTVRDTVALGDTTNGGVKSSTIDKAQLDHYNSGKVFIELQNGLPAEVSFNVRLLDRSLRGLLTLPQSGQLITLRGANVDANGEVTMPAKTTTVLELNQQEVSQYNPSEFVSVSVGLNTSSQSPTVQFRTDHQVKVRVWTTVSGKVGKQ